MTDETSRGRRAATRWRVVLVLAVIVAAMLSLVGWFAGQSHVLEAFETAPPVMRVHVVPNSNSVDDQTLKLHVRDALLPFIYELAEDADREQARERLLANVDIMKEVALTEIRRHGAEYSVAVSTETDGRGEVTALKVMIGAGAGNNWFCVLVPPLCFAELDAVEHRPTESSQQDGEGAVRFAWRWLGELFAKLSLPVERVGEMNQNDVDADLAHTSPRDGDIGSTPE